MFLLYFGQGLFQYHTKITVAFNVLLE